MNFKRKSILYLFVLFMLVLSACGSDDNKEGSTSNGDGDAQLSFVAYSNYEEPLNAVIEEFEADYPNISVELELYPITDLTETIEIKMGSKSEDVDLLFTDSPLTANYALKGYLEPLDELIDSDVKELWDETALEGVMYDDHLVAAPLNSSSQVLYINEDIFKEKDVDIPKADERLTWEELLDIADELTYDSNGDGQNDVFGFSFDQIDRAYQILALPDSLGAEMLSEDGLTSEGYTNSPEAVEALEFYSDLFNEDKVSPKIGAEESIDYFTSGKVAMFLGANHNLPKLEGSDLNYSVTLHPYFEKSEPATPTGAWNVGVSRYSQNKEAAAEFLEYLTTGEGAKTFFETGDTLPVTNELLDYIETDESYDELPNSVIRISAIESRETAVQRPQSPGYPEWETHMNRALSDIKNGDDPQETLDSLVKNIDRGLEKYKKYIE